MLTVTSGLCRQTVAQINFSGQYVTSNFHVTAGQGGVVEIVDPTVPDGGSVSLAQGQTLPRPGIDLPNIAFGAQTTLAYSENAAGTGGTLTVNDGRHAASIALLGNYMAASFVAARRRPWRHAGHRFAAGAAAAAGASAPDLNGGGLTSGPARKPFPAASRGRFLLGYRRKRRCACARPTVHVGTISVESSSACDRGAKFHQIEN